MDEIRQILQGENIQFVSLKDENLQDVEIIENGSTFEENAIIKARTISDLTGQMVLADDSGLEVDYLHGEPGIYSARYLGEDTSYDIKNNHIIDLLAGVPDDQRTARFVCVIACAFPDGRTITVRGVIRREDLYLMHHAKVPAVIVETGYLTNPSDCLYMRQEKGIRQTAWGIYQAVMETLEKY